MDIMDDLSEKIIHIDMMSRLNYYYKDGILDKRRFRTKKCFNCKCTIKRNQECIKLRARTYYQDVPIYEDLWRCLECQMVEIL